MFRHSIFEQKHFSFMCIVLVTSHRNELKQCAMAISCDVIEIDCDECEGRHGRMKEFAVFYLLSMLPSNMVCACTCVSVNKQHMLIVDGTMSHHKIMTTTERWCGWWCKFVISKKIPRFYIRRNSLPGRDELLTNCIRWNDTTRANNAGPARFVATFIIAVSKPQLIEPEQHRFHVQYKSNKSITINCKYNT